MQELKAEREAVRVALAAIHVDAWVFEYDAGARPESIQQTYLAEVDRADLYLGLFWKEHGDRTIEEFEYARSLGKDCLLFEKCAERGARTSTLQAFLDRIGDVETGLTIRRFTTVDELRKAVSQDVAAWQTRLIRKRAATESILPDAAEDVEAAFLPGVPPAADREDLLSAIDSAWHDARCRIFLVTGLGGTGKSAFVKAWIRHALATALLAEEAIVAWTFQPSGSGLSVSENAFFDLLRRRLNLPRHENPGSASSITDITRALGHRRLLIVLDGFEALLGGGSRGEQKAILYPFKLLLAHLGDRGLCVITSRIEPSELTAEGAPSVRILPLEGLSTAAGIAILRNSGITGSDDDLRTVVESYRGHPLALTLLGPYLSRLAGANIAGVQRLPPLSDSLSVGDRIRDIVDAYYDQLGRNAPALMPVLQAIAAFDAGGQEHPLRLFVSRRPDSPEGRVLSELDLARWREAIAQLQAMRLVNLTEGVRGDRFLTCHLLIRQAVRSATQQRSPAFWREINLFLADWFQRLADDSDGYERIDQLCYAVTHLCRAGAPRSAFNGIYRAKIMPDGNQAALRGLGRFSAIAVATAALTEVPAASAEEALTPAERMTALGHRGTCVMALYGHTVEELEEILLSVDDLARATGAKLEQAYANWMLHSHYLVTARLTKTEEVAASLARQAQRSHDKVIDLLARERLGSTRFYQGRFLDCQNLLVEVIDRLEADSYDLAMPDSTILDPRTIANVIVAAAFTISGDEARALRYRTTAINRVEEAGDPLTAALVFLLISRISHLQGSLDEAERLVGRVLALAESYELVLWQVLGVIQAQGYAALLRGPSPAQLTRMTEALSKYRAIGGKIAVPYCLGLIAEAHGRMDDVVGATSAIDEAIALALATGERWYLAELYRIRATYCSRPADLEIASSVAADQQAALFGARLSR